MDVNRGLMLWKKQSTAINAALLVPATELRSNCLDLPLSHGNDDAVVDLTT